MTDAGAVRTVTMTHPEKRNALSEGMASVLIDAIESASCRALILRAEPGATTWSAGHDIDDLPAEGVDPLAWTSPVERLIAAVQSAPFPVIAAVEGGAWGAGCNLALACDLLVARRSATFAVTPARLGLPYHPDGIAQFLAVVPLNAAKEMFFTAAPLAADSPLLSGTVNRLVDTSDELTQAADELAARIAAVAPLSVRSIKAEIVAIEAGDVVARRDGQAVPAGFTPRDLVSLRRAAWQSADFREGLAAFRDRRTPKFEGR